MADHNPLLCGISADCPGCVEARLKAAGDPLLREGTPSVAQLVESLGDTDARVRAMGNVRDELFAEMLTIIIEVAAERYPERLKRALASVFDVAGIEALNRKANAAASEVLRASDDARRKVRGLELAADDVAKRLDKIHDGIDDIARRLAAGRTYMQQLSDRVGKAFAFLNSKRTPSGKPPAAKGQQPAAKEK